jgi:hypothetical protein
MSFKDFIKNNIYESDKKPALTVSPAHSSAKSFINPQTTTQTVDVSNMSASNFGSQSSNGIGNTVASDDLEAARQKIIKLLDDNNQPGIDFHEYIVAKNGMSAIPQEADRYKIAFSSLSPIGLTKDILNKSGIYYISVVDNELKSFQNQFAQVNKSDVADKKTAIATKQDQMKQLADQIAKLNLEVTQMTSEVAESESTLNSKNNAFFQAANEAKQMLQTEIDKINQFIQ